MPLFRFRVRYFLLVCFISSIITVVLLSRRDSTFAIPAELPELKLKIPDHISDKFNPFQKSPAKTKLAAPAIPVIQPSNIDDAINDAHAEPHPIDELLRRADADFNQLLSKETNGLQEAADTYKARRGRDPPPRFDEWVKFAEDNNAPIIEEFFDQIYDDLRPFWAIPPRVMRDAVLSWPYNISIRSGVVSMQFNRSHKRMDGWYDMISQIAHRLPDVDLAVNVLDETRMLIPWESVNYYMTLAKERNQKRSSDEQKTLQIHDYPSLPPPSRLPDGSFDHKVITTAPPWSLAREACAPGTPAREIPFHMNLFESPTFPRGHPNHTFHGYVSNSTHASNPCMQAHFRGLHGFFIEPISPSIIQQFFPLFGSSKLPMNNDILLPSPNYWLDSSDVPVGSLVNVSWEDKTNSVHWRGVASGGRSRLRTWARFHRHRFVSMMNITHVRAEQIIRAYKADNKTYPELGDDIHMPTWPLPDPDDYPLAALRDRRMGAWVESFSDVAFTNLECEPREKDADGNESPFCPYTSPFYNVVPKPDPWTEYNAKYIPDLDGNSISPRFVKTLLSNSLPLKGTIFTEWHTARLVPWKHYIPLDTTYKDLWGVLEYFLGYDPERVAGAPEETGFIRDPEEEKSKAASDEEAKASTDADLPEPPTADRVLFAPDPPEKAKARPRRRRRGVPAPREAIAEAVPEPEPEAQPEPEPAPQEEEKQPAPGFVPGHDAVARHVAESGHVWARRALRKEDMLVYVYRLLLEYARVCDEERERMGWKGMAV